MEDSAGWWVLEIPLLWTLTPSAWCKVIMYQKDQMKGLRDSGVKSHQLLKV